MKPTSSTIAERFKWSSAQSSHMYTVLCKTSTKHSEEHRCIITTKHCCQWTLQTKKGYTFLLSSSPGSFVLNHIKRNFWSCRQTSKWCTGKPDPPNLYQDEGRRAAFAGVETCLRPTIYHLGPPDLSWHGCISDRGPAASGGQTVLANDRNGGRLRLIASHHDDDDDVNI